jgi:hypothetical protein
MVRIKDGNFVALSEALTFLTVYCNFTRLASEHAGVYDVLKGSWFYVLIPNAKR